MALLTLLIDADIIVHKLCVVSEQEIDWGDEVSTIHADHREMYTLLKRSLSKLKDEVGHGNVKGIFAFSSGNNFRKKLSADYKGNRGSRKPVGFRVMKDYMHQRLDCRTVNGLEADDVLGIMQTSGKLGKTVIVSIDKDLLQIPGDHYNPDTGKWTTVEPVSGYRYHMMQTLCGDRVDNYPGCPGVGDVTASKLLDGSPPEKWWELVLDKYQSRGLTEEDAILQARLAKILQHPDYNAKKKEPFLWVPPGIPTVGSVVTTSPKPAKTSSKRKTAQTEKAASSPSSSKCSPTKATGSTRSASSGKPKSPKKKATQ